MNSVTTRELQKTVQDLRNQQQEMLVVIDTLQTNLRSAVASLSDEAKEQITKVQSYKWCSNWSTKDLTS